MYIKIIIGDDLNYVIYIARGATVGCCRGYIIDATIARAAAPHASAALGLRRRHRLRELAQRETAEEEAFDRPEDARLRGGYVWVWVWVKRYVASIAWWVRGFKCGVVGVMYHRYCRVGDRRVSGGSLVCASWNQVPAASWRR